MPSARRPAPIKTLPSPPCVRRLVSSLSLLRVGSGTRRRSRCGTRGWPWGFLNTPSAAFGWQASAVPQVLWPDLAVFLASMSFPKHSGPAVLSTYSHALGVWLSKYCLPPVLPPVPASARARATRPQTCRGVPTTMHPRCFCPLLPCPRGMPGLRGWWSHCHIYPSTAPEGRIFWKRWRPRTPMLSILPGPTYCRLFCAAGVA